MKAVIVDDMPNAVNMLRSDLESEFPDMEIVGTAGSVVEGVKLLKNIDCDLLFLDVMLGDGTGFDILEIHDRLNAHIIFVTASDEHSLLAFRYAAIDYLLKPYSVDDLRVAVERAQTRQPQKEQVDILQKGIAQPGQKFDRISLHTQEKIAVVEIKDIVRCESDDNNTLFYLNDGQKIFVTRTLKQFENLLSGQDFLRVHQSHLVNFNFIKAYVRTEGGYLLMKNDDIVPVSVRKKPMVVKRLG